MRLVFSQFFGRDIAHYTTFIFCGNVVFSHFSDASSGGMTSLMENADIFTKVNVPKYLFLFSKNASSFINFSLTFVIFIILCAADGVAITPLFLMLIFPIICLSLFNIGIGLILSAMFVFFRDIQYLWSIFTMMLTYVSAIFYSIDGFSPTVQAIFHANPVFVYIKYFRLIVLEGRIPSPTLHLLDLGYALIFLAAGLLTYKKCNHKFLYYV
jgi:ABC-2 type transport system permease protein